MRRSSFWLLICALASFFGCTVDSARESTSSTATAISTTTFSVADVAVAEGDSPNSSFLYFGIVRTGPEITCDFTVTLNHASTDANDLGGLPFSQTFTSATVGLGFGILGDTTYEPDEQVSFHAEGSGANPCVFTDGDAIGTIYNDDEPSIPTQTFINVSSPIISDQRTFVYGEPQRVQSTISYDFSASAGLSGIAPVNGKVTLTHGALTLGVCDVVAGMSDCEVTGVPVGATQTIHGDFVPNVGESFEPSSDDSNVFAITPASTTAAIGGATPEPSIVGGAVDFSIKVHSVAPSTLAPTGSVQFFRDGVGAPLGTAALTPDVGGAATATFTVSSGALIGSVGSKDVHVVYVPDGAPANFTGSTSSSYTHVVSPDTTVRTLTASPASPWAFGAPVTFTATVANQSVGAPAPTGSVYFYDGVDLSPTSFLGSDVLHLSGDNLVASLAVSSLAIGNHTITALYAGDANHGSGTTSLAGLVEKATPTVGVLVNPGSVVYSQPVTLGATVTGTSTTPTGTVQFFVDGSTPVGPPVALISGFASLVDTTLAVGTNRPITAAYQGDASYNTATGSGQVTVSQEQTSTQLSTSSNPAVGGASVTLTATVTKLGLATATPQGTVTFSDGATPLSTVALDGSGVAKLVTSSLAVGTHPITAHYDGNPNMAPSSNSLEQVINIDGVTIVLTASPSPSIVGQNVTFTASFGGSVATPATGTAEFFDGATSLGTATLAGGLATLSTSALTAGNHVVKVTYSGDANHPVTSGTVAHSVARLGSTTTLATAAGDNTPYGVVVPLVATVTSSGGTPIGSVTFKDGETVLASVLLLPTGTATYSAAGLGVGPHALTATYSGDTTHESGTSDPLTHMVDKATSAIVVSSSLNPAPIGFNLLFSAAVTGPGPSGIPTGTVTFKDGATTIGSGSVNAAGVAQLATTSLAAGAHAITAVYAGDPHFDGSTSATLSQTVSATASAIALTSAPNPSALGASVTLNVSVSSAGATPAGNVTFKNGATVLGTAALDASGKASIETATLPAGNLTLSAEYAGDGTHEAGVATVSHVVQKGVTTTTLTGSASSAAPGAAITFTANVTSPSGAVPGEVELFDATTSLGKTTLSSGAATFSIASLTLGQHAITARYSGTDAFATSLSNTLIVTISDGAGTGGDAGADGGGSGTSGGTSSSSSSSGAGSADGGGTVGTSSGLTVTPDTGSGSGDDCSMMPGETGSLTAPVLLGLVAVLARRRRKTAA